MIKIAHYSPITGKNYITKHKKIKDVKKAKYAASIYLLRKYGNKLCLKYNGYTILEENKITNIKTGY